MGLYKIVIIEKIFYLKKIILEIESQNLYLNQKLYFHIERTDEINALVKFINNHEQNLIKLDGFCFVILAIFFIIIIFLTLYYKDDQNEHPAHRSILLEADDGFGSKHIYCYQLHLYLIVE
jgi:hypothetical protein